MAFLKTVVETGMSLKFLIIFYYSENLRVKTKK
jgi:hypothetical protein